jgi:hypothetical protein
MILNSDSEKAKEVIGTYYRNMNNNTISDEPDE